MGNLLVSKKDKIIKGSLILPGSKSISNRLLLIKAYDDLDTNLENLSTSDDTKYLIKALNSLDQTIHVGHAGTALRFLTSYLCLNAKKETIITGSARLKERPIAPLVEALLDLGCDISYVKNRGHAPLKITPVDSGSLKNEVSIRSDISSQFISSLLMMGPKISGGLAIYLEGPKVSTSYIGLTIQLMNDFGVEVKQEDSKIVIPEGNYCCDHYTVESDWSSVSYLYLLCALADEADLTVSYLHKDSYQGDAQIHHLMIPFGLRSEFFDQKLRIIKESDQNPSFFENDFVDHPDLFQGMSVLCAAKGITGLFSGLETLELKETDRISAVKTELSKFEIHLNKAPARFSKKTVQYYTQEGHFKANNNTLIQTYDDHRMALAFSLLGILIPIEIEDGSVVTKSYPTFWDDLKKLHFEISTIKA